LTWTLFVDLYRVESATVNPQDADEIYISTENEGLWYTNNATATTPTFVQLDEYVFQHPMRIFYDPFNNENVWVTSFGNGIKMGSTAPNTSGFSDIENASLSIFPNPSNGEITLTSTVEMKSVQVYDLSNRLLFSSVLSDQNKVEIDLEFLPAGIYFVQVTDKQGSLSTVKLVID
jgi:myo-inositol-hexaphosphate 3-phosphohydrolase